MNQNYYRLAVNNRQGQLIAAGGNSGSQGKVQGEFKLKGVTSAVCFVVGMLSVASSAHAQIVADQRAGKGPEVTTATNGTPLVNINAASAAGVSVNQYHQFSTDARGVVLNNSRNGAATQLGGSVGGNANLANGAARIIINQVTGDMPTTLVGNVEVAGQRAEVVLSNPNGITVNGAGFINTSRAVLTTGTLVFGAADSLDGIQVQKGEIIVNKLDGRGTDQVDLIARAVKINGDIHAKNALNVVAGNSDLDYASLNGGSLDAVTSPAPAVAIDVAALGGMYAKKIQLIGTERGVGVNIAGTVIAERSLMLEASGDLSVRSKGRLEGGDSVAAFTLGRTTNEGMIATKGDIVVNSDGVLTNAATGVLQAARHIDVSAGEIVQAGKVAAGGHVRMQDTSDNGITNSGEIKASDYADISSVAGSFRNTRAGTVTATKRVNVATTDLINEGVIASKGHIAVTNSGKLINAATGKFNAGNGVKWIAKEIVQAGELTSDGSVFMYAKGGEIANSGTVTVKNRDIAHLDSLFMSSVGNLRNTGVLQSDGAISLFSKKAMALGGSIYASAGLNAVAKNGVTKTGTIVEYSGDADD